MIQTVLPLIVIVGETASGKSGLALAMAECWNGEIIAADSRTVYRGMDIGTAKPTADEQTRVPHHLIDVVAPDGHFSVADFQRLAREAIASIHGRGKLPIVVGGTGLYVDALLYDFQLREPASPELRKELASLSVPELQARIRARGLPMPQNEYNPRHLARVLETNGQTSGRGNLRPNTLLLGLRLPRDVLEQRVRERIDAMVVAGFVQEVQQLLDHYSGEIEALRAPGYKAFRAYLAGDITLEEAKQRFATADLRLAKRQRTWFKRNPDIQWCSAPEQALRLAEHFLSNYNK